ncbi:MULTISPECIES: ParB/RepB/Spo0J family partition protein [unclassified Burkholderia]|uniref:ParB/RepB/Spo0J family partition protein n=1 Tax=unclassified Burkholderia TaxID=2613784 RepID=UPI002AB1B4E4|nr:MULTISPECIES: ParB/RepB/Spo0J family partition protein [unclassified Burkholderia]
MSHDRKLSKIHASLAPAAAPPAGENLSAVSRLQRRLLVAENAGRALEEQGEGTTSDMPGALDTISAPYRAWCAANRYTPGQAIDIPLECVRDSRFNPRHFYPHKLLEPLIANIVAIGQQQPIHVVPDYEHPGDFILTDGGRRTRSMRALNRPTIRALVVDVALGLHTYKLGYDLNTQRNSQTVCDNAIKWRALLDEGIYLTQRDLAADLKVDVATVSMTLKIGNLPEPIMDEMVLHPDTFGPRMAFEINRYYELKGLPNTLRMLRRIIDDGIGVRQVKAFADAPHTDAEQRLGQTAQRNKSSRYKQRIDVTFADGSAAGLLKTYGNDRIDLELSGLPLAKRDEIVRQITAILEPLSTLQPEPALGAAGPAGEVERVERDISDGNDGTAGA